MPLQASLWKELLQKSEGMTVPAMISNAFTPEEIGNYLNLYREIFQDFVRRGVGHAGFKVFVDNKLDNYNLGRLMEDPPKDEESLNAWANRLLGDRKFGFILNNLEKYSNRFAETIAGETDRLLEQTGMPLGGLAFLLFAGNYGLTPFGVHKDNPGEEGFLFHMGPGKKVFYTWETERFLELSSGNPTYPNAQEILHEAEHSFHLEPGDVVFVPSSTYHVADTPEFSVSMVMDFVNPPVERFKRMMANRIGTREESQNFSQWLPTTSSRNTSEAVTELLPLLSLDSELERAVEEHTLLLQSNGGYYTPSTSNKTTSSFSPQAGESLGIADPFRLFYRRTGEDQLTIYCRGHEIRSSFHPNLSGWLDSLNDGKRFTWEEIQQLFEPEWDMGEILMLLSGLGSLRGTRICKD